MTLESTSGATNLCGGNERHMFGTVRSVRSTGVVRQGTYVREIWAKQMILARFNGLMVDDLSDSLELNGRADIALRISLTQDRQTDIVQLEAPLPTALSPSPHQKLGFLRSG